MCSLLMSFHFFVKNNHNGWMLFHTELNLWHSNNVYTTNCTHCPPKRSKNQWFTTQLKQLSPPHELLIIYSLCPQSAPFVIAQKKVTKDGVNLWTQNTKETSWLERIFLCFSLAQVSSILRFNVNILISSAYVTWLTSAGWEIKSQVNWYKWKHFEIFKSHFCCLSIMKKDFFLYMLSVYRLFPRVWQFKR